MRRAWTGGLLLLLLVTACADKAPAEGAVRVEVHYGSYLPACVRVVARDGQGHGGDVDILQSQFKDTRAKVLRIGVFREADWERALTVEVSSFTSSSGQACAGAPLETFSQRVEVPLGSYAPVEATLLATDGDGDGVPAVERSATGLDCDDSRADVFPGAPERCTVGVDYDCDGFKDCQDSKCQQRACDDGNACTKGEVCVGSGTTAKCLGQEVVCARPESKCFTSATCARDTGECVSVPKQCTAPSSVCLEGAGACNEATGNCEYRPKPAATSCDDGDVCTTGERCNGQGSCLGTRDPCTTSNFCFRATGTCAVAGSCGEEPDPNKVDAACPIANETLGGRCRVTSGKCSRFPYEPSHFDPDAIASARITPLTTTTACDVTFDSTTLEWRPASCVSAAPMPIELSQVPGAVLLPILNLSLGGQLKLVGNRPVILAVYGDATLNQNVLAAATGITPGAGGSVAQVCETRRGRGGVEMSSVGGGGGGAGGGVVGARGGKGSVAEALPGEGGERGMSLAGGCSGGGGGGESEGGRGGAGGGMVQVSVAGTLTVGKTVSVSGGGGQGGGASLGGGTGGGGGGGSGGRILLEAQQVVLNSSARLTANGGGGGEGGGYRSAINSSSGEDGADGYLISDSQAQGGAGGSNSGGNGGAGGGRDRTAEGGKDGELMGNDIRAGGGGGGGAVGIIRLRSLRLCSLNNAVISPTIDRQCPL